MSIPALPNVRNYVLAPHIACPPPPFWSIQAFVIASLADDLPLKTAASATFSLLSTAAITEPVYL
jgi:hypothetical protein